MKIKVLLLLLLMLNMSLGIAQSNLGLYPLVFDYGFNKKDSVSYSILYSTEYEVLNGKATESILNSYYRKYDLFGNIIEYSRNNIDTIFYIYDEKGNWIKKTYNQGKSEVIRNISYYNDSLISKCETKGMSTFLVEKIEYNKDNLPIKKVSNNEVYLWEWGVNKNLVEWKYIKDSVLVEKRRFYYKLEQLTSRTTEYYLNNEFYDKDSISFIYRGTLLSQEVVFEGMKNDKIIYSNIYLYDDNVMVGMQINKTGFQFSYNLRGDLTQTLIFIKGKLIKKMIYDYVYLF